MKALQFALKKLARRQFHSQRLMSLLFEAGFDEQESAEAIVYLKNQGYLDDADFAANFVRKWQNKGKSGHEIRQKAKIYGIPLAEIELPDEREAIVTYLQKRSFSTKEKAFLSLKRKGFSSHTIIEILNNNSYNK